MGKRHLEFLEIALKAINKKSWSGVKMLELGNQKFYEKGKWGISGKEYFEKIGVDHVSIDINGEDGALNKDLRLPISGVGEPFDIVTNFGTIEHVEGNQYQPYKTMHDLVNKDGVLITIAPGPDYSVNHSKYKYGKSFFEELARKNSYDIIKIDEFDKKIICICKKINNNPFILESSFNSIERIKKITEGGNKYTLYNYANYEEYKKIQIETSKAKEAGSWVQRSSIKQLSKYILKSFNPKNGICHGTRRGNEQAWFMRYLPGCKVIGTEISDNAEKYPNTIQWDFHDVKPEWIGKFDFIYSNSFDHSYKPADCFRAWCSCLKKGGMIIIEHSNHHIKSSIRDPFGVDLENLVALFPKWNKNYYVAEILEGKKIKNVRDINFIIIKERL